MRDLGRLGQAAQPEHRGNAEGRPGRERGEREALCHRPDEVRHQLDRGRRLPPASDRRLYRDQLGFKVHTDQPFNDKQRWIELKIPNAATGIVLFTPEGQEDRIGTFFNGSFTCDSVEKTYEELKARGVEFSQEPKAEPWGTFAIFKDVDGNSFVLGSK